VVLSVCQLLQLFDFLLLPLNAKQLKSKQSNVLQIAQGKENHRRAGERSSLKCWAGAGACPF